ncbi:hypothetical protein [Pseudonocardia xishanensis]|uniref:Mce-associated membrane protein n=1 Tax=Pseudonocardia xishanensis TaxID=630995 RepID=A0ABP8RLX5_9PSEU
MPIRSPRGRAAAYRALWSWPLRSPLRLAVTAVVVAALALLVSLLLSGRESADQVAAPGGRTVPTTSARSPSSLAPTALPPVAPLTPTTLPLSAAPPAAVQVAQNWAAAWANHPAGTTTQTWVAGLTPFTTAEYVGTLSGVDPANIPASRVTGPARPTEVSPRSISVEVPTDAVTLAITVVETEAGWRVAGYDQA